MINLCLSSNSSVNATGRSVVVIFWHTQTNCYAGAVGLPVWTGDDSWSACSPNDLHCTLQAAISLHHASDPHGVWAWDLHALWQWHLFMVAILLKYLLPWSSILFTLLCFLFLIFFSLNLSCDPVCNFRAIIVGFWCAWETLSLLEQVAAITSHLAKLPLEQWAVKRMTCSEELALVECKWLLGLGWKSWE